MEQKEIDSIFLDEEGYKKYIEETKKLKEDYDSVSARISKIILDGRKEDATSEYESLMITRRSLKSTIETREREEHHIVIVSREENSEFLDIGDVVKVKLEFPNGYQEEDTFELTAGENDFSGDIPKVSINKPVGKCVYKKNIGDSGSYDIREGKVVVNIIEKVKVKKYSLENN